VLVLVQPAEQPVEVGTPEETLDTPAGVYLADPNAWREPFH
jgi:hypothetical protein